MSYWTARPPTTTNSTPLRYALTICLLLALSVFCLTDKLLGPLPPLDEGLLLADPDLILRGYTPYKDFAALYPPGNFYLIAAAFRTFGSSILVERLVGVAYQVLLGVGIYLLGRRVSWSIGVLAPAASLTITRLFPFPGAYAIFAALAVLAFAMLCAHRACAAGDRSLERRWSIVAGLLAATIVWFRQDVSIMGIPACAVTIGLWDWRRIGPYLVGVAVPVVALLVFALYAGPGNVFDSLVLDAIRVAPGRKLPIQLSPGLCWLAVGVAVSVAVPLLVRGRNIPQQFVWLARGGAVVCVGLLPSVLQRVDEAHLAYIGAMVAGLAIVSLGILFHRSQSTAAAATAVVPLILGGATLWLAVEFFQKRAEMRAASIEITSGSRAVVTQKMQTPFDERYISDIEAVLGELNRLARPGETVFVGPQDLRFSNYNDTFLYYLLPQLRPASRYVEMEPGAANRPGSGLAQELAAADWLILTSRYDYWAEPNASSIPGSSAPNDIVRGHFCPYWERGAIRLLGRCRLTSSADAR
jgi:hypothetical protein